MATAVEMRNEQEQDGHEHVDSSQGCEDTPQREVHWYSLFSFMVARQVPLLCISIALSIGGGAIQPLSSLLIGKVFDALQKKDGDYEKMKETISENCLRLFLLALAIWCLQTLLTASWFCFAQLQTKTLREDVFAALLKKEISWFDTRDEGVQAILARLQTQIHDVQDGIAYPMPTLIEELAVCVSSLVIAMKTSWKLTLVTMTVLPLLTVLTAFLSGRLNMAIQNYQDRLKQAAKVASQTFRFIDTVKCFNAERFEHQQYVDNVNDSMRPWLRQSRLMATLGAIGQFFFFAIFVIAFWYGSHLVTTHEMNPGDVVTAFWSAFSAMGAMSGIMPNVMSMKMGQVSAAFLAELIEDNKDSPEGPNADQGGKIIPSECEGNIHFRDVTFCYPSRPDVPILNEASLFFGAGELTFVVGHSGSGKSTIGSLLIGLYRVSSGMITIDGTSIDELSLSWLRKNITLVQQRSILFKETIRKNIALGGKDPECVATPDILECLRFASLEETIGQLPDGLDTHAGGNGDFLSGGQQQRVALARARLRDTPVLILDESTSALDYTTRVAVMDEVREWREGKTTIIITHDVTQINDDDYVYMVEQGNITKRGRKEEIGLELKEAAQEYYEEEQQALKKRKSDKRRSLRVESFCIDDDPPPMPTGPIPTAESSKSAAQSPRLTREFSFASRKTKSRPPSMNRRSAMMEYPGRPLSTYRPTSLYDIFRSNAMPQEREEDEQRPNPLVLSPVGSESSREFEEKDNKMARHGRCSPALSAAPTVDAMDVEAAHSKQEKKSKAKGLLARLRKEEPDDEYMSLTNILKTIPHTLSARQKLLLALAFVSAICHATATPFFSHSFGELLGTFSEPDSASNKAKIWSLSIIGIAVLNSTVLYSMTYLMEYIAAVWANTYRHHAMDRVLKQPKEWFELHENKVASLSMTLDQYGEEMKGILSKCAASILTAVLIILIGSIWSIALCWKLTLVGLSIGPALYLLTRLDLRINGVWNRRYNTASEEVADVYIEAFTDVRTIRSLTLEAYFQKKLNTVNRRAAKIGFIRAWYTGVMGGWSQSCIFMVYALIFWYGGVLVSSGAYKSQSVISSIMMLTFTVISATGIFGSVPQLSLSQQSARRLLQLGTLPEDASHESKGKSLVFRLAPVTFEKLNFAYEAREDALVLRNVSFEVPNNSCVALVGASGSGKSTIASILLKLYASNGSANYGGSVMLNGVDLREVHTQTLRSLVSVVPQTPTIFPSSIAQNITYGMEKHAWSNNIESIRAAAQAAGIDEFIMSLPEGYNTVLGENGVGLSGGQAQRLAIARALVRKPMLLILDEATANLDQESAALVKDSVRNLLTREKKEQKKMTVLVITHARDMVELSDKTVVLNEGRVVEVGGTQDLLRRSGGYLRELFRM